VSTTSYPNIIGLNGVARSGKDTIGHILHQIYGYRTVSFSDALNKALIALNPWVIESSEGWLRYADTIDLLGYEKAKEIPEVRALLQRMGTEVGRDLLGANIWVDALFRGYNPGDKWAVVNVRFPNEYQAVKDHGGVVWRVDRPGYEAAQGHISDRALDAYSFDHRFYNDGTIGDLAQKVISVMDEGNEIKAGLQAAFNGGSREG
jgi:hypothetical protein